MSDVNRKINEVKVYINSENMATFTCPQCQLSRTVDVTEYADSEKAVRIKCKCKCGNVYSAILERRKHYRKMTKLPGSFTTEDGRKGLMTVTDVSRSGMGFTMNTKQRLEVGQRIVVEFRLDDQPRSEIKRQVVIRSIRGEHVGTEFTSLEHYDRLGPYLL